MKSGGLRMQVGKPQQAATMRSPLTTPINKLQLAPQIQSNMTNGMG